MRSPLSQVVPMVLLLALASCQAQQPSGGQPRKPAPAADDGGQGNGGKGGKDGKDGKDGDQAKVVTYDGEVKALLQKQCVSCHGPDDDTDLSTYEAAKAKSSGIASEVKGGTMPPSGPLKAGDKDIIAAWVKDGALKEKPTSGGTKVSYDGWVKGFLKDTCLSCHAAQKTKPDLSTYDLAKAKAKAILTSVESGKMPKSAAKVAPEKLAKLKAWVDGGTPEKDAPAGDDEGGDADAGNDDDQGGDEGGSQETVTYDGKVKALLQSNCVSCHKSGKQSPDLATKDKAKSGARASLAEIEAGRMPPSGALSPADTTAFKKWVDSGTP